MNIQDKKIPNSFGLSTLLRPQYSPGQLLDDDDLNAGVTYTWELTRLLFRSLFGCGVICGLHVKAKWVCEHTKWSITVTKGLALDCLGDPIELLSDTTMNYGQDCQKPPDALWVTICYVEKCCRPKDVTCSQSDDTQTKLTRVRSGYEIRLYETLPKCACHCATSDDTAAPTKKTTGCCQETSQPVADAAASQRADASSSSPICSCYKPHFEGECECGCSCKCVILGKITAPTTDKDPLIDNTMVRRIRPLLNGYVYCGSLQFVKPTSETPNETDQGRPRTGNPAQTSETRPGTDNPPPAAEAGAAPGASD